VNTKGLQRLACQQIDRYRGVFREQNVIVCDTETVKGKPYSIQFYNGLETTLIYVNEHTIFDTYLDYIKSHYETNLSVWFFYCQFDLPIIHYPYKNYFSYDNHTMGYGEFDFKYVTGKTWYGDHTYQGKQWCERDAFQYVFRGLEKIAKDLNLNLQKKPRPSFLGERGWKNAEEKKIFEEYAIADVLVLWELVYWILNIHRIYDVGLSVSLADLAGKIFRKKYIDTPIIATDSAVTLAALASYHGGKTQCYVTGPCIIQNVNEYDITSAYPYAMTQIGNFFDYHIIPWKKDYPIQEDALYKVNAKILCDYQPIFSHDFKRQRYLVDTWITGYELQSCQVKHTCLDYEITDGYLMESNQEGENGLAKYVWEFFEKKQIADRDQNISERLIAKLFLNALYGKFISKISEEYDSGDAWRGGVIFHPLIASLITGFVRSYCHEIEHACTSLHTSTDAFISQGSGYEKIFQGENGLGGLKHEYSGDVLIVRPKVYIIFDKLAPSCYHKFDVGENNQVYCVYCKAKVLKHATHGFFGSVQMLLNMWRGNQTNYIVKRMIRLKEAKRSRDPDLLPFVFTNQRRSMNVDWSQLTLYKGV
jgi:hypothetical protein